MQGNSRKSIEPLGSWRKIEQKRIIFYRIFAILS